MHPEWFGDFYAEVSAAWPAVQRRFRDAEAALEPAALGVDRLAEHGLVDEELAFKMALWDRAMERLKRAKAVRPHEEARRRGEEQRGPDWVRRLVGSVQKGLGRLGLGLPGAFAGLLRIGNIILGSLGAIVPPAGGIKEFKESVEEALGAF